MDHYTTIKQSKKLLELGLNPETADMVWIDKPSMVTDCSEVPFVKNIELESTIPQNKLIHCWSVGKLLELMPFVIIDGDNDSFLKVEKGKNNWLIVYSDDYSGNISIAFGEDELINTAYNMIVWLLENNYIKTEK